MCEWFDRKLNRSSASSTPTMRSPSSTTTRWMRFFSISAMASPSWSPACMVTSAKLLISPTGRLCSGRPSSTARCSALVVKMPVRAGWLCVSRTSTEVARSDWNKRTTSRTDVLAFTISGARRKASSTRDSVSECS